METHSCSSFFSSYSKTKLKSAPFKLSVKGSRGVCKHARTHMCVHTQGHSDPLLLVSLSFKLLVDMILH